MVQDTEQQLRQLTTTRHKLEHQQSKLLQAHYEDAISLDVLKREQHRITQSLNRTTQHIGLPGVSRTVVDCVGQAALLLLTKSCSASLGVRYPSAE